MTPGPFEFRDARLAGVSFPKRTIELIVVPYDEQTIVEHRGRMVRESFAPGSFDGIERRANRVRVYRGHEDLDRNVIGRAVSFHPSRAEGLVAELRIAKTTLGDDTLTLAADGCLDASAGFRPMHGGETWPERDHRRVTKAFLGHIAMTPDPAYLGAGVLAVRGAASHEPEPHGTPHLDEIRAWALEARYARGA